MPFKRILPVVVLLLLQGCSLNSARNVVQPPVDWEFIRSVGGIAVGQPRIVDNIFWLPLTVDLSGSRQISVAPTLVNSGRKCIRAELSQGNLLTTPNGYYDLHLRVFSGDLDQRQEGGCDEVALFVPSLKPPLAAPNSVKFRIWYKDFVFSEHYIGEVSL